MGQGFTVGDEDKPYERAALTRSVLVVEDDLDLLDLVRAYLEPLDVEIITTTDTEEALRLIAERPLDVVVCDVGMPKHNGLELTQLVREAGYRGKLVLMTGWDIDRVEHDQRSQGCDLLLKKPFLGAELVGAVDQLLRS